MKNLINPDINILIQEFFNFQILLMFNRKLFKILDLHFQFQGKINIHVGFLGQNDKNLIIKNIFDYHSHLSQGQAKVLPQNQVDTSKSLRGGGACCSHKIKPQATVQQFLEVPQKFFTDVEKYKLQVTDKIPLNYNTSDILVSFQWFIRNEIYFWIISNNRDFTSQFYDFSISKLEQLLVALLKYIKISGYFFYLLLKIVNLFLQIIVKQQSFNEKRFVAEKTQEQFKALVGEIKHQIEIESIKVWETGVKYELILIETAITHLKTNSTKGQDILLNFIAGFATSLAAMKYTDELKNSFQEGGKLLLNVTYYEQILNPIENYKVYQFFKELKWQILLFLGKTIGVYYTISKIKEGYEKYIKNSKNWIIHFCWIEMISEILIYQPILNREEMQEEDWNQMLASQLIKQMPSDKQVAVFNINVKQSKLISKNQNC